MKGLNFFKLIFLLLPAFMLAQVAEITGTVFEEETGLPASDVEVKVQGTERSTTTNDDGMYSIQAKPGDVLVFIFDDLSEQSATVESKSTTVNLTRQAQIDLDEVVTIGYGTADKRDLTGSIVKIDGEVVADKPNPNPVASLQGRVAGLNVVNSGRLGQEPDVRIRGTSSRYSTGPLYVVDGIFADNIDFVNPNDIKSIEVLKDASSLAIFGVRGANGVIIVNTTRGKKDALTMNFNSTVGFKTITSKPELADAALFRELYDERLANEGLPAFGFYDQFNGNTDWIDQIANEGFFQTLNFNAESNTEKNKLYFGVGFRDEEGLIIKERLQRITLNINDELRFNDNFKIGVNVRAQRDKQPNQGGFGSALNATPIVDPLRTDDRPEFNGLYNQLPIEIGGAQIANPYLIANVTKNKTVSQRYRFVGSLFAEVKFLKDFTFRTTYYGDYSNTRSRSYTPVLGIYAAETDDIVDFNGNDRSRVNQNTVNNFNFQQDYILNYDKSFGNHNLGLTAGFTTTEFRSESLSGQVLNDQSVGQIPDDERFWYVGVFPYGDPDTRLANSSQFDRATASFLGRAIYNYDRKYLLNASYRRDASSQLSPSNRSQDFWSLGAAWVVTRENFAKNLGALDFLKFKGSIGQLGNQFVPVNYPFYPGVNQGATAIFGDNVIPGYVQRFEENPNLKWETVRSWEAGFESRWLNNRLTLNGTYYNRDTEDLLVFVNTGTQNFFDNAGEINNRGFEFEMSWNDRIGKDFTYGVGGNFTTIQNEVVSVFEDGFRIFNGPSLTEAGNPIGYFYGYVVDGIYQTQADIAAHAAVSDDLGAFSVGDFKYRDVNGDGIIDQDDRTKIGNPTPDFTYGFYVNLGYKNFFLDMDFQGVYGNEVFRNWGNGNSFAQFNYRQAREDRWTGQGTSNFEPRLFNASGYNRLNSTYMIEDGSYFRIRNIQLGYRFDPFKISNFKVEQLKLSVNVQNAYTWHTNSGFTPEAGGSPTSFSVDNGGYPVPRVVTFGLSTTF